MAAVTVHTPCANTYRDGRHHQGLQSEYFEM